MMKAATQEEAEAVILVFWDMDKFPVPYGFDGCLVRPCIKRFMESHGYYGDLTISAYGVLYDVPLLILRGVYSTGIQVTHIFPDSLIMMQHIHPVTERIPPPANIIVITERDLSLSNFVGYNIVQPFPCGDDFQSFLLAQVLGLSSIELQPVESPTHWDCLVCNRDPPRQGFRNLMVHLSGEEHKTASLLLELNPPRIPRYIPPIEDEVVSPRHHSPFMSLFINKQSYKEAAPAEIYKEAVTLVFWVIDVCPVPTGFDARLAGPHIRQHLKNLGYSGPLTITAAGLLTEVPDDVLRGLYSGGIRLTHVLEDSSHLPGLIDYFTFCNKPRANVMVIADLPFLTTLYFPQGEHNFLYRSSLEECLAGEVEEEEECGETGEWVCMVCRTEVEPKVNQGFENFTRHLASRAHECRVNEAS